MERKWTSLSHIAAVSQVPETRAPYTNMLLHLPDNLAKKED